MILYVTAQNSKALNLKSTYLKLTIETLDQGVKYVQS